MVDGDFGDRYAEALLRYLDGGGEASLAAGHDLGRRALQDRLGVTDVVANHVRLVEETPGSSQVAASEFLLPGRRQSILPASQALSRRRRRFVRDFLRASGGRP